MKHRVGIIIVAFFVAVATLLVLESFLEARLFQAIVIVTLNLLVMGIGVVFRPTREMPIFCDPFVWVCAVLSQFFALAPIIAFVQGFTILPFFTPPSPESMLLTLFAFLVMITCFIVGHGVRLGIIVANLAPEFGPSPRKLPGWCVESAILGASLLGCFSWLQGHGGLMGKLSAAYGSLHNPALYTIAHMALLVGTFLTAWRVIHATRRRRRDTVFLLALLVFDGLFYGVLMGVRKYLLFLFFGTLTIWLLRRGVRALPKVRTAVVLVILLIFFSVWGAVRGTPVSVMLGWNTGIKYAGGPRQELSSGYLTAICDPFGGACKVMEVFPDRESFRHGRTLVFVALGFIPRAVWPDKPVGIGKEISRYWEGPYFKQTTGHSAACTFLGELWVNFGWPGIVAGGFLLGVLCRSVTAYAVRGMKGGLQYRAARVLIPAVFIVGLGEVRADLAAMVGTWALAGVPLLVALSLSNMDGSAAPIEEVQRPVVGLRGFEVRG